MKTLTFAEFYRDNWRDEGYELYILKDSAEAIMYIGISSGPIWNRWFGGLMSHMEPIPDGTLRGISHVGEVVERRFPESWNWRIELWTLEDCIQSLLDEGVGEIYGRKVRNLAIKDIEAYFIKTRAPYYNVMHAGGSNQDPLLKRQLDEAYNKIFRPKHGRE